MYKYNSSSNMKILNKCSCTSRDKNWVPSPLRFVAIWFSYWRDVPLCSPEPLFGFTRTYATTQIIRKFFGLIMQNFECIDFIRAQIYREIFKSALVYLYELNKHFLLFLVLLQILMVSKKEAQKLAAKYVKKFKNLLSMLPNTDINWCWLIIQFAIHSDFSKSAVT